MSPGKNNYERATFGAGCFWGVEAAFRNLPGVIKTTAGYSGGNTQNPTYEDVCGHETGHAEVVQIEFNPDEISYDVLLRIFFKIHDPTTPNRQGPDVGSQYRSVIFCECAHQKKQAQNFLKVLEKTREYSSPIVTQILPLMKFFPAEEYHQQYYKKKGLR